MPTPHNSASLDQIATTVLMPGDPLRSRFIAQTLLEDPILVNDVRGIQGYTGSYKGRPLTVMASGMGMPSIGIYSYELFKFYHVDRIIRVGTAGGYIPELHLFDVVLATSAWSDSSFARVQSGDTDEIQLPSAELNEQIRRSAQAQGIKLHDGRLHSSDVFYSDRDDYVSTARDKHGCCCVEMESFALFHTAKVLGKAAACLVSISDSFVHDELATAEQRQTALLDMLHIALGAV